MVSQARLQQYGSRRTVEGFAGQAVSATPESSGGSVEGETGDPGLSSAVAGGRVAVEFDGRLGGFRHGGPLGWGSVSAGGCGGG